MTETAIRKLASERPRELAEVCEQRLAKDFRAVYLDGYREGAAERRSAQSEPRKGGNAWKVNLLFFSHVHAPAARDAAQAALDQALKSLAGASLEVLPAGAMKTPNRFLVTDSEGIGDFKVSPFTKGGEG